MSIEVTLTRELPIAPIGPTPFPTEGHSSKSSPLQSWSATHAGAALSATHCVDRPLLQQKVLDAAQKDLPGLAFAIGYCIHKVLVKDGALQAANLPGRNPRFKLVGHKHHRQFQCRRFQPVFNVHACQGALSLLAPLGFTVEDHDLTL